MNRRDAIAKWRRNKIKERELPKEQRVGRRGYVYVFQLLDDLYKIGRTTDYTRRLRDLQAGNPKVRLVMAYRVFDMVKIEKKLHKMYKSKNVSREVFKLTSDELLKIRTYLNSTQFNTDENSDQSSDL